MNYKKQIALIGVVALAIVLVPGLAHAGALEDSLISIKLRLTGTVLPLLSVIGIAIAAISFFTGNPQAKQHIVYAVLGCCFGFGAQAIVDFISDTVH